MTEKIENFRLNDLNYKYVDSGTEGQVDLMKDKIEAPSGERVTVNRFLKSQPGETEIRGLIKQGPFSVNRLFSTLYSAASLKVEAETRGLPADATWADVTQFDFAARQQNK